MNIFGKKTAALNNVIKRQASTIKELQASELRLMMQIREMDQLIFQMAQCSSWNQMRPLFEQLQAPAANRMRLESDRIKTLLIPEMQKAYRK